MIKYRILIVFETDVVLPPSIRTAVLTDCETQLESLLDGSYSIKESVTSPLVPFAVGRLTNVKSLIDDALVGDVGSSYSKYISKSYTVTVSLDDSADLLYECSMYDLDDGVLKIVQPGLITSINFDKVKAFSVCSNHKEAI